MSLKRIKLPALVFMAVWVLHYFWLKFFPENGAVQSQWVSIGDTPSSWRTYIASQSYFLSYTYALSLAFVAVSFRRYRESNACPPNQKKVFLGSIGVTGFLSVAGCFLVGCCGSPMLGVYLSIFGAKFLPFTKPLIAAVSTVLILGTAYASTRSSMKLSATSAQPGCACD